MLLLSRRSEAANVSKDVAVMFHTRRAPWEAALLVLHRVSLPDLAEQGVVFSLLFSACAGSYFGEGKAPHLDLTSNRALFVRLARLASDWSFHFLEVGKVLSLVRFDVVAATACEESSFETKAKEALEVSNTLQALSHLLGNHKKRAANQQSQNEAKEIGPRSAKRPKTSHALSAERRLLGVATTPMHRKNTVWKLGKARTVRLL